MKKSSFVFVLNLDLVFLVSVFSFVFVLNQNGGHQLTYRAGPRTEKFQAFFENFRLLLIFFSQ